MSYPKYPLTIPQQNIWNLQKYYPDTAISNLCGAVFYKEKRREDFLEQAINQVIRSQSGLRMRFSEENGQPVQVINEFVYEKVPVQEFSSYEEFEAYAKKAASAPIGLTDRRMYYFEILRVEGVNGVLALLSHLIADAWTFSLIGTGIDKAYRELAAGQAPSDKIYDYTDYIRAEAEYLESPKFGKDERFWREKYGEKPEPAYIKADPGRTACIEANRYSRRLDFSVAHGIREFSRDTGITEAVMFETAFGIYLSRLNPENRTVTMGTPVLNRSNVREKHTIGMFISTMPLTVEISWEDTVLQVAKKITVEHGNLFRHQKYPYSKILENIRENHEFSGSLYEVMVSYQNAQMDEESDTRWFGNGYSETPFVFHIDNRDKGDTFTITVDYQTRRFSHAEEISLIVDRLEHILQQMTENGERPIREISILPEGEEKRILLDFNRTFGEYPRELCVHQLFTEQAGRTPEKTALVFENRSFSYRELEEMSNSLAFLLRENGIGPGRIVPILAKRSWHILVAMLGVLKAGGAYMPVSPDYPMERIRKMIEISKAKLVLRYGYEKELPVESWDLERIDFSCHKLSASNQNRPSDLCYVIFTSGSTGEPKGISLCHRNVVNYCWDHPCNLVSHEMKEAGLQRIVSVTNIIFDIFVTESLLPLLHGMTIYFANDSQVNQQGKLSPFIRENQIEVIQTTPSKMRNYLEDERDLEYLKSLKCLFLGGEVLSKDLVEKLRVYTGARIFNVYGPAETTVWSSNKEVEESGDITIGRPITNTQIYILDGNQELQPIGVVGEIGIAGDGVGKGYLNRSELTVERFIPNPFATKENSHGETLYLTGDLGCRRTDGEIEYWGRGDTQVKIRGLRIELGEIESTMSRFPGITMAAVADGLGRDRRQYLAGYYTARQEIDERKLRRYLSSKLPKYMVPNYFLRLDEMPMTASGKTDRKRLPKEKLDMAYVEEGEFIPPETDTEKTVSAIWRNVLHVERAGKKDDFWELGGDSLLAIQILNQIESQFQVEISVKEILEHSSLEELAAVIEKAKGTADGILIHGRKKYRLLPQQRAIYAACQREPDTLVYNMPAKINLSDKIDRKQLKESIVRVFERHMLLKSRICLEETGLFGIYDDNVQIVFEEYEEGKENVFVRPFDLGEAPLMRVGFTEDALLFDMHHIIADGSSVNILLQEIGMAYGGGLLPEQEAEYPDYAEYFYSLDTKEHKAYFQEMLKCDWESIALPETKNPEKGGMSRMYQVPEGVLARARTYARKNGLTDTMVFFGAYGILLSKYTGRKEILSSIILQNRIHGKTRGIVGMFANTLPVCLILGNSVAEYMQKIKEKMLGLFRYQELPFEAISEAVGMDDRSVVNTSFVYQGDGEKTLALEGQQLVPQFIDTHTSKFDLSMELTPVENGCRLRLEYNTEKYDGQLIDALAESYIYILDQLEKGKISDISVLSENEYHRIVEEFNDTYVEYPRGKCIHELFMEQTEKTPERIALVFEDQRFTYRQLDKMSNSLAHLLRGKGIGPNDVVPIIARRSWHVIVAMLGVLKAGGAYMPVAPDYPRERVKYMLETASSRLVLVYGYDEVLGEETIRLDSHVFEENTSAVRNVNSPEDSAYIIFTSGSTGKPKGVTICHHNVCNYADNNTFNSVCHKLLARKYQSIVSVTNIIFDIFVTESLLPLMNGLCVYFASDGEVVSPSRINQLITRNQIDILQTTPTKMKNYLMDRNNIGYLNELKAIILGGEAFPKELYHTLKNHTDAHIYNIYGPAETTVWSTNTEVVDIDITIGTPIANTQIYILDGDQRPVPIGVPGELCIAGEGVGKGYLNRPELTTERFVPNPFATTGNRHGKIMYHTGDLARFRSNGNIECLGRMDNQVKIRGLRIELEEIESIIGSFPNIGLCAVADKRNKTGRQYLVGYYTVVIDVKRQNERDNGEANTVYDLDEKALRAYLSSKLPKYMVPNYFIRLETMPMTASGKIDRKNLPLPDLKNQIEQFTEPTTDFEIRLARIWQRLLQIEKVGKYDDFFELGGDSLLAISMLNEIQTEFHVEISMKDIMEKSSLEELAGYVGYAPATNQITAGHEEKYILLPQQKAIYAACSKRPDTLLYNIPTKISLSEAVDFIKLRQSIQKVFDLHRILKSRIQVEENEIYGIYDKDIKIEIEEYQSGEEAGFIKAFDLEKGPLVHIGFTKEALLFDIHHIIADGSSVKILLQNIVDIYEGKEPEKSELEFSDYAKYFYKLDTTEHKAYFKNMMCCDLEPVVLPKAEKKGQGGRSKEYLIPEEVFWKARKYARKHNITETMVFLGAYGILLSKYTGKDEIISSIILQNRVHAEIQNLVGMFVNTLPAFLQVKGNVLEYMNGVKELLLNLYRYQELPFWDIANAIGMKDKSVINTSFVYQSDGEKVLTLDGRKFKPQFIDTCTAKFDLSAELVPLEKECRLRMEYNLAKFDEPLMDAMVSAYILILSQLEKEKISDITILSEAEYHRLIDEFNDTYVAYPKTKCIHERFSEQVKKTPDKTALVFEDKKFTYTQLDKMSNSLAHFLKEKGIKPNEVIPVIAKRSWHVIVAMLGVLKAGGAYMPVAPDYPVGRIETMLEIAESRIALLFGFEKRLKAETIELKDFNFAYRECEIKNVNHSEDTAYVIFTSGSTGTPKGISVCHRNVCNYADNNNNNNVCHKIIKNHYESIVSVTNIVFDIFVTESILPLLNGLCIYFANETESMTQTGLSSLLEKNQVDVLQTTPAKMRNFIMDKANVAFLHGIKAIVLGGEEFQKDLCQELRSYTNAKIYNIYGPAETTVWSTNKLVESGGDITIGKPIANTQVYILDKYSNPLPVGVPGELCIAGDGVGKGYLNRPELTAERFVPNPFATAENRHGKVMYRTGDLACWLENGELQYLGRIDTQVKIRGLRIELGEIESVMSQIAGVRMAAVADKRDGDGRQYLAGYYVADEELDRKELRRQLGRRLPQYMIPHYFVRLKALPMTPSGKIDRRNLPLPDFTVQTGEYTAPATEKEKRLCEILGQILGIKRIGAEDDFFELGFDSLKAIELVAKAHQAGIEIGLQQVFDYPTVRKLCGQTEEEKEERVLYKTSDFESLRPFLEQNVVDGDLKPRKRTLGNVLLTGATGFLGAHILYELMKEETGIVYCVVRSGIEGNGEKRLKERLEYYFGSACEKEFGKRIIPVSGDLEREDFLDEPLADIQTVIHSAASVKHYGSYEYFYRANVLATEHVVKFAKSTGARLIHISTLSVSGNSMADQFSGYRSQEEMEFDETSFFVGQPLDNVYIRSKFEAERKVFLAMAEGLEARIIRVGNLTNRFSDFKFQPNYKENAFLTRVKAVLELGCFPDYLLPLYAEFSPVDLTAEGVVKIARYGEKQCVFHLNSNRPVYFGRMMEIMEKLGISMKILDREAFGRELGRTLERTGTEYIFKALQNDMDTDGNLVYDSNIRIKNDATLWFLKCVGFEWKEIDYEYLRGYVDYFRNLGYLEAGNEK